VLLRSFCVWVLGRTIYTFSQPPIFLALASKTSHTSQTKWRAILGHMPKTESVPAPAALLPCLHLRLTRCHCSVPVTTVCPFDWMTDWLTEWLNGWMTDWLGDGLSIPLGRAHAFADAWPKTKVGNGGENGGEGEWGSHKENLNTVPKFVFNLILRN